MRLILIADDDQSSFEVTNDLLKAVLAPTHRAEDDQALCEALRAGRDSLSGRPTPPKSVTQMLNPRKRTR